MGCLKLTYHQNTETPLKVVYRTTAVKQKPVQRFYRVDPLAEKMPSWGGYTYTFNNPIKYVDPDGKRGVRPARPQARRGGHINNNQIRPSGGYRTFERYNPVSRNNKVNIDYFENTNIPGGSSYTDPVISIGNIRGHRFNAAIEGFRKVIELSSYSVIIRQENRNHGNGKFSEDIDYRFLFDDVEAQNTYLNAQQLYQEEFGVRLRELNESTSLEEGNKNMTNILNIIQVRIEMGKSPEDMLLDDFKQNQEMKFELIDSRTEQIPIIYETVQ